MANVDILKLKLGDRITVYGDLNTAPSNQMRRIAESVPSDPTAHEIIEVQFVGLTSPAGDWAIVAVPEGIGYLGWVAGTKNAWFFSKYILFEEFERHFQVLDTKLWEMPTYNILSCATIRGAQAPEVVPTGRYCDRCNEYNEYIPSSEEYTCFQCRQDPYRYRHR